jgi:hypothetical protein
MRSAVGERPARPFEATKASVRLRRDRGRAGAAGSHQSRPSVGADLVAAFRREKLSDAGTRDDCLSGNREVWRSR